MNRVTMSVAVMIGVTYLIRVLPLTLIRRPIQNRLIQSFLFYVPYVTLAVMTFPAIVEATQSPIGIALALAGAGLFPVAVACCAVVFIAEWFLC